VVSFTPLPLYLWGNSSRYQLDRSLGGPQSRSGRLGEQKVLAPTVASRYTDYAKIVTNKFWIFSRTRIEILIWRSKELIQNQNEYLKLKQHLRLYVIQFSSCLGRELKSGEFSASGCVHVIRGVEPRYPLDQKKERNKHSVYLVSYRTVIFQFVAIKCKASFFRFKTSSVHTVICLEVLGSGDEWSTCYHRISVYGNICLSRIRFKPVSSSAFSCNCRFYISSVSPYDRSEFFLIFAHYFLGST
jgi:hypothetical protein